MRKSFEIYNPQTKAIIFEGFTTVDTALKRIKLCKRLMPDITLRVRPTMQ